MIVLVGEAPGATEIREEQPFRGPAGDILWEAVAKAGLRQDELFVVNSVACIPFDPSRERVKPPSRDAVRACHDRLGRDLGAGQQRVLVALGRTAVLALTGCRDYPVTNPPDRFLRSEWGPVIPAVHPGWVMRSKKARQPLLVASLDMARSAPWPSVNCTS